MAAVMLLVSVVRSLAPGQIGDLGLEEMPGRQVACEAGVAGKEPERQVVAAAETDLHVVADSADEPRNVADREGAGELLLHRLDEQLLPRDPVDVRVGVPEADEVERRAAGQALVARLEIDLRVPVGTALVVEVAAVDVHPDAAEDVDDLLEAAEVDRHQVVHRQAGQRLHRRQAAGSAAERVGGVDLVQSQVALARALDVDLEVAREGQHRDRVRARVGAEQHHRVRARRCGALRRCGGRSRGRARSSAGAGASAQAAGRRFSLPAL